MVKKKGKKRKAKAERPDVLHEVDKTFYELQITDLNRKLARLRAHSNELEEKITAFEQTQGRTEADRIDVISYLKRALQEKTTESLELQDRVATLKTAQESNEEQHQEEINQLKAEFEGMRQQLISEVKLITGKLNALEEFRMQRDDLMSKFEIQENLIEEQEIRHRRNMYEVERKFVLGKDAVKHEMEQQLFQLAKDFESANELRIAATTQRVIRENIVVNNELNKLIFTSEEFQKENTALKAKVKDLTSFNSILESERNKALKDYTIQKGIIHQMVNEIGRQKDIAASQECDIERGKQVEKDLKSMRINEEIWKDKIKSYEQQIHSIRCNEYIHKKNIRIYKKHIIQLKQIIYETVYNFEILQTLEESKDDDRRTQLYTEINNTLRKVSNEIPAIASQDTMLSASQLYDRGDLGFMSKIHRLSKPRPMRLHAECQVGPSFQDFQKKQKEPPEEETHEVENVPELFEYDFKEVSDSSEATILTSVSEESAVSSKENEKEVIVSQVKIFHDEVELEVEEEYDEEEEEERSIDSNFLDG